MSPLRKCSFSLFVRAGKYECHTQFSVRLNMASYEKMRKNNYDLSEKIKISVWEFKTHKTTAREHKNNSKKDDNRFKKQNTQKNEN